MQSASIPKVVFVLGAGASNRLGFPLGNRLKRELLQHLRPGNQVFEALRLTGFTETQITRFTRTLSRAEHDTIDDHLREITDRETHEIGKRAVAYVIRGKENEDSLFHEDDQPKHWYKEFANHLRKFRDHVTPAQFSFITFNYDRSLTHYLHETLGARNVPPEIISAFLGDANFHHVHGHVGPLPWQLSSGGDSKAYYQYGASLSAKDIASFLPQILHPDDHRHEPVLSARIIGDAQVVAFVGFGFHTSNLKQLPFAVGAAEATTRRFYVSINPASPPTGLLLEGKPVRHFKGPVEGVIRTFFTDLVSGELLNPRPKSSGRLTDVSGR